MLCTSDKGLFQAASAALPETLLILLPAMQSPLQAGHMQPEEHTVKVTTASHNYISDVH